MFKDVTTVLPTSGVLMSLFGLKIIALCLLVLLPVVPAYLVYRISPDSPVRASGKFFSFRWNASGAFAVYLIVFFTVFRLDPYESLKENTRWEVNLQVEPPKPDVFFQPSNFKSSRKEEGKFVLHIVAGKSVETLPEFSIQMRGIGSKDINLQEVKAEDIKVDENEFTVKFMNPIKMEKVGGRSYQGTGSKYQKLEERKGGSQ